MTGEPSDASAISTLNDAFRKGGLGDAAAGQKVHTAGIDALPQRVIADIWRRVAEFDAFTADNDPYGEHDFGAFDHPVAGRILWKIDYYDATLQVGARSPADPSTRRVLTVMLADEY